MPTGADVTPAGALQRRLLGAARAAAGPRGHGRRRSTCCGPTTSPRTPPRRCRTTSPACAAPSRRSAIASAGDGYRWPSAAIDVDADVLADAVHAGESDPAVLVDALDASARALAGPGLPRAGRRRRRPGRGGRGSRSCGCGPCEVRAEGRLAAGDTDELVAELAAAGRRAPAAGAAPVAADGGARRGRPARSRRCASTTTSGACSATSSASSRRRRSAAQHADAARAVPTPATVGAGRPRCRSRRRRWSAGTPLVDEVTALGRGPAPGDAGRSRRRGQDPAAGRGRPPPAGGAARPAGGAVRAGRRPTRSAVDVVAAALGIDARPGVAPRRAGRLGARRRRGRRCCSTTASTCSTRSPSWSSTCWRACPNVTVVATSRERLRVPGEQLWPRAAAACSTATDAPGGRSCSSSGPGRWSRPSTPDAGRAGVHRRDRAAARRPAAGDRAGRGPPAHPRPRRGRGRASTTASRCCRRATGPRRATARCAPRWRGRSGCSTPRCSRRFADLSVFAGSFTRGRRRRGLRRRRRRTDGRAPGPARRAVAGDAGAGPPVRAARDAAGVRRRAARPRTGRAERGRRAPRPPPGRLGRATPTGGCSSPASR